MKTSKIKLLLTSFCVLMTAVNTFATENNVFNTIVTEKKFDLDGDGTKERVRVVANGDILKFRPGVDKGLKIIIVLYSNSGEIITRTGALSPFTAYKGFDQQASFGADHEAYEYTLKEGSDFSLEISGDESDVFDDKVITWNSSGYGADFDALSIKVNRVYRQNLSDYDLVLNLLSYTYNYTTGHNSRGYDTQKCSVEVKGLVETGQRFTLYSETGEHAGGYVSDMNYDLSTLDLSNDKVQGHGIDQSLKSLLKSECFK